MRVQRVLHRFGFICCLNKEHLRIKYISCGGVCLMMFGDMVLCIYYWLLAVGACLSAFGIGKNINEGLGGQRA